jgi:hypothetical protein
MMIPYPSSSPIPVNSTAEAGSFTDITGTIVGSVAIGALGVGTVFAVFQYMKTKSPQKSDGQELPRQESNPQEPTSLERSTLQEPAQVPEIKVDPEELSYLCVNTADLEEITQILATFKKRFHVIQGKP